MDQEKDFKDVLKWIGIALLAAIPVVLLIKKLSERGSEVVETSDIFAEELS
jgi:biopolymer transport protein ExbB/TolQ